MTTMWLPCATLSHVFISAVRTRLAWHGNHGTVCLQVPTVCGWERKAASWHKVPMDWPLWCHIPFPFLSSHFLAWSWVLGLALGSLAFLYNHWLPSLHPGDIKHPFLSLCPILALGFTIRETKPTGCKVHLHGLSLLLPKAVVYQLLDLSHSTVLSCLLSTSLPPV